MIKVYAPPEHLKPPKFVARAEDYRDYEKRCDAFVNQVKGWAKSHGSSVYAGEEVRFPHADGYARYVVMSLKPTALIHLNVGDAWQYPYIERLKATDIVKNIQGAQAMAKLFS
jgi:hypothetical protein